MKRNKKNISVEEVLANRDKLIAVLDMVKMDIERKYLNQVIGFLDDIAEGLRK